MKHQRLAPLFLVAVLGCASAPPPKSVEAKLAELMAPAECLPPPVEECPDAPHCVLTYRFSGHIEPRSVAAAERYMRAVAVRRPEFFVLELNTGGGDVESGFELARAIEAVPVPVVCVVDGQAASMGFFVLQSCPMRVVTRRSSVMTHEVGQVILDRTLKLGEVRQMEEDLRVVSRRFAEFVSGRMGMPIAEYEARVASRDWDMDWAEAVRYHAADRDWTGNADTLVQVIRLRGSF